MADFLIIALSLVVLFQRYIYNKRSRTVGKILRYTFDPINWRYIDLTDKEKELLTEQEFELLKLKYSAW